MGAVAILPEVRQDKETLSHWFSQLENRERPRHAQSTEYGGGFGQTVWTGVFDYL